MPENRNRGFESPLDRMTSAGSAFWSVADFLSNWKRLMRLGLVIWGCILLGAAWFAGRDYWQSVLIELGAGTLFFTVVLVASPRSADQESPHLSDLFLLACLPLLALASFGAARAIDHPYWRSILIEFGGAVLLFALLDVVWQHAWDNTQRVLERERAREEAGAGIDDAAATPP